MVLHRISLFWSMIIEVSIKGANYKCNLNQPLDISIPLHPEGPRAWYVDKMKYEPVMTDRFTGSVELGGAVNFRNIFFNPHGHGTHTETLGHIDEEIVSINKTLKNFFFPCRLVTIDPKPYSGDENDYVKRGDEVISRKLLEKVVQDDFIEAVVIRTIPNTPEKLNKNYSNTNPPFFLPEALSFLREKGVKHLLTDLPSVDREEDGGILAAHHAFWKGGRPSDRECTITEFVYAPKEIGDGLYLLNLQIASFENDAAPSKPVLYQLLQS